MKERNQLIPGVCRTLVLLLFLFATSAIAQEVSVVGTGDGVMVLKALRHSFESAHPGVTIQIPDSIGSSGGIKAVGEGTASLARVARPLKEKEQALGLEYRPFAKVPVVFFVNPLVEIQGLSAQEVCAIYSGKITNWKEVGGNDLPITVVRREEGDSSLEILRKSFPGFKELVLTSKAALVDKTPEMFAAVMSHPAAIGFGPFDVANNSKVKVLPIDRTMPTYPSYPSVNTLAFVYKKGALSGSSKDFVEFATAPTSAPIITAAGGVPLTP